MRLFLWTNFGTGRGAVSMNDFDESLRHVDILMFTRLIKSG